MTPRLFAFLLCSALLAAPGLSVAQSSMGELKACTWIADETERLACFDRVTKKLQQAPAAELPGVEAPPPGRAASAVPPPGDRFGLPPQPAPKPAPAEDPDERQLVVAEAHQAPFGEWVLVMQDGQVWRQADGKRIGSVDPGTQVHIEKGWLGGYLLTVNGHTVRAKRVR